MQSYYKSNTEVMKELTPYAFTSVFCEMVVN